MNRIVCSVLFALLSISAASRALAQGEPQKHRNQNVMRVEARPGVPLPYFAQWREGATATLVMFSGSDGGYGHIDPATGWPASHNFLIRTARMFQGDRPFNIVLVGREMLRGGPAAQRLDISPRQLERLVRRYLREGAAGLFSRKRGGASNHQSAPGFAERAISLIRERYADFGPTLAAEKLQECHGVMLSKETVRSLMTAARLQTSRRMRPANAH